MEQAIEKIIIDWLKSGNENVTYCAYLIAEAVKKFIQPDKSVTTIDPPY